jgi:hypothetical protein
MQANGQTVILSGMLNERKHTQKQMHISALQYNKTFKVFGVKV